MYIELPGELYLRFLKLTIIPLLVSNVILSFGRIQSKITTHLGKVSSLLYLGSNLLAIIVAILLVFLISPGCKQDQTEQHMRLPESVINNNHIRPSYLNDLSDRYRGHRPTFQNTFTNTDPDPYQVFKPASEKVIDASSFIADETLSLSIKDAKSSLAMELSTNFKETNGEKSRIRPVKANGADSQQLSISTKLPIDVLLDVLRNLVPDSIIGATMQQQRTRLRPPSDVVLLKNGSTEPPPSHWPLEHEMIGQSNIIGLLAISVLTGVVLSQMEDAGSPVLDLCECVAELSLRISMMAINLSPFCIMFLLIGQVARARDLSLMAGELCFYCSTVILGLLIHGFILAPLLYYFITKQSPIEFLTGMVEALVASFATSSSSASMALTLRCLSDLKLHPVIVRAFGPLGLVFNMNGTTIYEVIGTIFIAQTLNVSLPFTSVVLIGLSSIVASLSTSGIPSSGLMTMVIVLDTINLPVLQLSLLYIVDFIIDRFRTVINVWTGAIVCGIINSICPESWFETKSEQETSKSSQKLGNSFFKFDRSDNRGREPEVKEELQVISVTITPPQETSSM